MVIRKEEPKDYAAVYELVKNAFGSAQHADGNEQDLVCALRKSDAYIPELSLVAVIGSEIAGHIMFTRVKIAGSTQLALAPLSVLPKYQRRGIGMTLIQSGHAMARKMGFCYSVVLGSEKYYPKAGYVPAREYGIVSPFPVPYENFMVCRLADDAPEISGTVEYAREFGVE